MTVSLLRTTPRWCTTPLKCRGHRTARSGFEAVRPPLTAFNLLPNVVPVFKVSDGNDQGPEEVDYNGQDVGGPIPGEQYPLDFENFPTLGGPMGEGGIQVPLPLHPLPPHHDLVPQLRYGGKANTRTPFTREHPIIFVVKDQAGMSLLDAFHERFEGLVNRDDDMFVGCRCTAISLRIQVCTPLLPVPLSTISRVSFTVARVSVLHSPYQYAQLETIQESHNRFEIGQQDCKDRSRFH